MQTFRDKYLFNPESKQDCKRTADILNMKLPVKCLLNCIVIKLRKLYVKV